jgi:hypothetical protein
MARGFLFLLSILCALVSLSCKEAIVEGGKCTLAEQGSLIGCKDPQAALRCDNLRLQALPCRGEMGCRTGGERGASCDESVGREGDPCQSEGHRESREWVVCAEDKRATLICKDGKLVPGKRCGGKKGCVPRQLADYPDSCDRSIAKVGEPCRESRNFDVIGACSEDGKAMLGCDKDERGKFEVKLTCNGPKGCSGEGSDIACDRSVATPGAPCGKDDERSSTCAVGGASVLQCEGGTWKKVLDCDAKSSCVYQRNSWLPKDLCRPAPR